MPSTYETLLSEQEAAIQRYAAWEETMVRFSFDFMEAVRGALGWPSEEFERLEYSRKEMPPGARSAPVGCVILGKGYCFGVRIILGNAFVDARFAAKLIGGDTFEVDSGDRPLRVRLSEQETFAPFVDELQSRLRGLIAQFEFSELTAASAS